MANWDDLIKNASTMGEVQVRQPAVVEVPKAVVKVLTELTKPAASGNRKVWTLAVGEDWAELKRVIYAGAKLVEGDWSAGVKVVYAADDEYVEEIAVLDEAGVVTDKVRKVVRVKDGAQPLELKITMGAKRGRKDTPEPAE